MAEFRYEYKGLTDRQARIAEAEGLGLVMLHDNFSPDWEPGEEPRGVLVFVDITGLEPALEARSLAEEIDEIRAKLEGIGIVRF